MEMNENLNEMIQQTDGEVFDSPPVQETTEKDFISTDKVLTWDDEIEPPQSQTEDVKKENNTMVPSINQSEVVTSKFQAKSEEDLINHTKYLYARMEVSVVMTYWHIGQGINSFSATPYLAANMRSRSAFNAAKGSLVNS